MSDLSDDRHRQWQENVLDALDGALAPSEARELELHLASCASCAALRRELERVDRSLQERLGSASLDDAFDQRVLQKARAMDVADPAALQALRARQSETLHSQLESSVKSMRRVLVANVAAGVAMLVAFLLTRLHASPDDFIALRNAYEEVLQQLPQQPLLTTAIALVAVVLGLSNARAQR